MPKTVAKLVALYNVPEDERETFDQMYFDTHVPLIKKVPGLRGMEIYKTPKNMMGGASPYYMIATLTFDDIPTLKAAMSSPEGQEAGKNIMGFAAGYITMLTSEVEVTDAALV